MGMSTKMKTQKVLILQLQAIRSLWKYPLVGQLKHTDPLKDPRMMMGMTLEILKKDKNWLELSK